MKLPKSWKDVTLKQFDLLNEAHEADINNVEKTIQKMMALTGEPREVFASMTVRKLHELYTSLTFLDQYPNTKDVPKVLFVNDKEYRVHTDIASLNAGRALDLINTVVPLEGKIGSWKYLVALLTSEPGEPYDYNRCTARADEFYENASVEDIAPLAGFFLLLWTHLLVAIEDFSMERLNILTDELIQSVLDSSKSSQRTGDGSAT